MQRRLAAIVHADLAGFTRMMEGSETRTFRHLKAAQIDVWRPAIVASSGRLVGTAGDAMLAEFGSAVTAVSASIDIQERMARFNETLDEAQRMMFRIGVHLGEVIVDDEDQNIFGDGVNLAARIQSLAEPGGIAVSRGCVRRCHGDLTLRNICLFEGEPALFDALEFDEGLATIDVLYDLAFPLMDLWRLGARDLANLLFNRYLDARDEADGLPLLPLFMATRAVVRAHVTAALAKEAPERLAEAQGYFALAEAFLEPRKPLLVALGGFSGSGKSTLSARLASALGPAPGARIHATDRIRKALHGVAATDKLPLEAYAPEVSARVYAMEREACAATLRAGHGCIAEAVFDRAQDRAAIEAVALAAGVRFAGFWLEAPVEVLAQRIAGRRGDPSDADEAVMRAQVARGNEGVGWTLLDAAQGVEAMAGEVVCRTELLAPE